MHLLQLELRQVAAQSTVVSGALSGPVFETLLELYFRHSKATTDCISIAPPRGVAVYEHAETEASRSDCRGQATA